MLKWMMCLVLLLPAAAAAQQAADGQSSEGIVVAASTSVGVAAIGESPAQSQAPATRPDSGTRRRPSMVGYVNDSTIQSQVRIRFDAGYHITSADRAEFFYAKYGWYSRLASNLPDYDPDANGPWPGFLADGNFGQLYLLGEYGVMNDRASLFVELPFRWLRPQAFVPTFGAVDNQAGLSDLRVGAKLGLTSTDRGQATLLVQVAAPTGEPAKGLGTGHASIEPALLLANRVGERTGIEAQFGAVVPIGGSAGVPTSSPDKFAGSVLYYGLGPSFDVYESDTVRFAPVIELVGWRVLGGFRTACGDEACFAKADDPSGNIVNLKVGARLLLRDRSSVYVGFGKALTDQKWYDKILRLEFRRSF
jgi:hypothetical protein